MRPSNSYTIALLFLLTLLALGGCQKFIFGDITVNYDDNPLEQKKTPRTGADLFVPPVVTGELSNPDPEGALKDWATCLVMFKEGHPHGGGKLHGNFVYDKAPWRQEEFVVIHNTADGKPRIEVDRESTVTYLEKVKGIEGPNYVRIIGGPSKLWGLCLYFFDKEGKLLNDEIYKQSDRYQIFFTVSDTDSIGQPYEVMDVRLRYRKGDKPEDRLKIIPVPSKYFSKKSSLEDRARVTPQIFRYIYRDTWTQEDMSDGVRELFNIRLLPPLDRNDSRASAPYDQDYVGLKGHLCFDTSKEVFGDESEADPIEYDGWDNKWPLDVYSKGGSYPRTTYLLPQFFLAIRVMKCPKGKKAILPMPTMEKGEPMGFSSKVCAPSYRPAAESEWEELIRFNVPVKFYTNAYDSDPTKPHPNEPYYVHLGLEIGLTPEEGYKAINNVITHGSGGAGYGAWFL